MWIAVCDDDLNFGNWIMQKLDDVVSRDDQITFCNCGIELIETVRKAKYPIDLILLDIEMPGLSGIESAFELRDICPGAIIVIVTRFIQYALKCYEIKAFDYLVKPLNIEKLKRTVDDARHITESLKNGVLRIETRTDDRFIPFNDLLYIESLNRTLYAHTRDNSYKFNKQISQIDNELEGSGFFRIHKSFIVNLSHVKFLDKSVKTVVLTTGHEIPVAKEKVRDLASALIDTRRKAHN